MMELKLESSAVNEIRRIRENDTLQRDLEFALSKFRDHFVGVKVKAVERSGETFIMVFDNGSQISITDIVGINIETD